MSGLLDKDVPDMALRSVFKKYDKNGDSTISVSEFKSLLADLGCTCPCTSALLATIDSDTNVSLSYAEFAAWWRSDIRFELADGPLASSLQDLLNYFNYFDHDKSHHIASGELSELLKSLSSAGFVRGAIPPVEEILRAMDNDKSGQVSFGEFALWYQRTFCGKQ